MNQMLNFNDVDLSVKTGQQYGGTGEDSLQHVKKFGGQMEAMFGANAGAANNRNALTSGSAVTNGAALVRQMVDQAARTVLATKDGVQGDEQAMQDQNAAFTANQGSETTFSRPVTL